ncbi:MAG TPA: FAD-binding oxidoreductase [Streptosporangiaceae bacterium]
MDSTHIDELRAQFRGPLIGPADPSYDEARAVNNGMIDRRPALIVRCADTADVITAVRLARDEGLEVSVRGGGHNVNGFAVNDGGLVIDLSGMTGVRVDPVSRIARVEGGATWGDLDHATHAYGLATTGGIISTTGVGGLTLGGGIGHLARGCGLSCDNLLSADVVTADGRVVVTSEKEHPDLFWALRGGGGNFGVVTSLEFRLHPVDTIYGGPIFYEMSQLREALTFYREFMHSAPPELGAFFGFHRAPPLPFIPADRVDEPMCVIVVCYTGDHDTGAKLVNPLIELGPPVGHHVGPMPYPALQSAFDALIPPGLQHYWKAEMFNEITDEVIDAHERFAPGVPHVSSAVHIYPIDGAPHQVGATDTAFSYRDARYATVIAAMYPDPADNEANRAWVRDYWAALRPNSAGGPYVNFAMRDEGDDRVAAIYRDNYDRLRAVKAAYDPGNLFRQNQNITPSS